MSVINKLPAFVVILMLLCGAPLLWNVLNSDEFAELKISQAPASDLVTGKTTLKIERVYKDIFPIRDYSVGGLNALSLGVFKEVRKNALLGEDNWYFTAEEFSWDKQSVDIIEQNMNFVQQAADQLAEREIKLIVALLPEKASVYEEHLGSIEFPEMRRDLYQDISAKLTSNEHIVAPNLFDVFNAKKGEAQLFLKSDTHWTTQGAGVTAQAIAEQLSADEELTRADFALQDDAAIEHSGDLYKFAKLSIFSKFVDQPLEPISKLKAEPLESDLDDLFGSEVGSEAALVGTSYSANDTWSFNAQLKFHSKIDVVNYAEEGQGPFKPMQSFLKDDVLSGEPDLKYVVWEIPLRYFDEKEFCICSEE